MSNKIAMRLQTPADEDGVRKDIHPITTANEVIVDPESDNPITLAEKLRQTSNGGTIVVQEEQPSYACIWAKPIR